MKNLCLALCIVAILVIVSIYPYRFLYRTPTIGIDDIQPGDIILTVSNSIASVLVMSIFQNDYTHMLIVNRIEDQGPNKPPKIWAIHCTDAFITGDNINGRDVGEMEMILPMLYHRSTKTCIARAKNAYGGKWEPLDPNNYKHFKYNILASLGMSKKYNNCLSFLVHILKKYNIHVPRRLYRWGNCSSLLKWAIRNDLYHSPELLYQANETVDMEYLKRYFFVI